MGDIFASLLGFLLSNVDRKSGAKSWPLALLAAVVLGGLGVLLWRYPDPAEMAARRFPALALFGLGGLCAAWGLFLLMRQRPRTLPADRIVIGIARLHPVGGERADAIGGEAVEDLYHALREARAAGAPIDVRRVYARVPEGETDEERMETARSLARQPNVRVHLLVWGDVVVGRRRKFRLHIVAGERVPTAEFRDTWAQDYAKPMGQFPDLSFADYLLVMCGDAFAQADDQPRALACYGAVKSLIATAARGSVHMRLADAATSHEASGRHLRQALSEFDQLISARPNLAGLQSYNTLRGRMEWKAVFGRLNIRTRLAAGASVSEQSILVPRLQDEYRTAFSYASAGGFEGSAAELDWLGGFTVFLQRFSLDVDGLRESQHLAEWILRTRVAAGHEAAAVMHAGTAYLASTNNFFLATSDQTIPDAAEHVLQEILQDLDPFVAESLLSWGEVELGLMRVAGEGNPSVVQQRIPTILAAGERLLDNPLVDQTTRHGVLYSLALAHGRLADVLPPGPDRRAHRLAAAKALETARQLPGAVLNAEGLDSGLSDVYLGIAMDQLDSASDAAQFARLARALLEGLLSDPRMLAEPSKRAVTHYNCALSLWVIALDRAGERPMLVNQAREHARAAGALGIDPAPLFERFDALGTSPQPQSQTMP